MIKRALSAIALLTAFAHTSICSAQSYPAGACTQVPNSQNCIDDTPCKTDSTGQKLCLSTASLPLPEGALSVPYTCWQYSYEFACTGTSVDTCAPYRANSACGVVSSICNDKIAETGLCDQWTYTYSCLTKPAQTEQQMQCTGGLFDTSGFPKPPNNNNSFIKGALGLEILGQAQTYTDGNSIFKGVEETCTKGYMGIKNCCKSAPGGQTNSAAMGVAMGAAASVVKYAGAKAVDFASPYVFDTMFSNGIFSEALAQNFTIAAGEGATTLGTNLAANGFSVGAFGFTAGFGSMTGGVFGANIQLMSFQGGYIAFNPYVFAAAVAMQVVMQLMQCTQDEQLLALHKGAGLSTFIKEECSQKVLGTCMEYTDTYCSFNSQLAQIINIQGKTQLGLELAGCGGLTPTEISAIDFTKIDFSAFTTQLQEKAVENMPVPSQISGSYQPIMQQQGAGTKQSSSSANLPKY